ncbi:DUF3592 domain-containing protein [Ruminococcus albus]|uniref:DUF3592 domain-containing protein n=1 Tax=Ruminococcus albus TaxID=1264 RepID=A0A1H7H2Y0_RUMAL|nr:DUF3592 domain-containing protein [Ruminococcus albus]SEK44659.1 Protein of unknown function [Ruminococcus albus]
MARRNTQSSPGFMIFIGIVMVVMSMVIFTTGNNTKKMHKRCTQSTNNGIVQSVTKQRRTRKTGKHSRTTYYVYPTSYTFDVEGKAYSGSSTLSSGQRVDVGTRITVYYNPSNPAADHYTRYDDTGTGGMVASVFVGLIGVILFVSGIKTKASRRNIGGVRGMAAGAVLSGMNGNNNYNYNTYNGNSYNNNGYNNGYNNNFNNNYNNGFNDTNSYNNNYNNGYNNNNYNSYDSNGFNSYNNGYNNTNSYNNGYNNDYNNSYNNNNVYSGSSNNYNDFNQLN